MFSAVYALADDKATRTGFESESGSMSILFLFLFPDLEIGLRDAKVGNLAKQEAGYIFILDASHFCVRLVALTGCGAITIAFLA